MLYLIPFLSALSGWLFHKGLIYFLYNRTLPDNQDVIAERLSRYAASGLRLERLAEHMAGPEQLSALKPEIEHHIDVFLQEKMKEKMPMIAMFVGEKTIDRIKEGLLEEITLLLPVIFQKFAGNLDRQLDIAAIVRNRISGMDKRAFVQYIKNNSSGYADRLALYGALAGFVGGWLCVACFLWLK